MGLIGKVGLVSQVRVFMIGKIKLYGIIVIGILLFLFTSCDRDDTNSQAGEELESSQNAGDSSSDTAISEGYVTETSPDGQLKVTVDSRQELTYGLDYKGEPLINSSKLGFEFRNMSPMAQGFVIESIEKQTINEDWEPVWGQRSLINNHYNQLLVHLKEDKEEGRFLDLEFRIYDDGIGFRYMIPEQEGMGDFEIMDELTEFAFTDDHTAWWIRNDWDSYEYLYDETPLSEVRTASTPFTMKTEEGIHISIHEAALIDYAGMALKRTDDYTFEANLAPWPDKSKVKTSPGMKTPWRTIQVGEKAGDLVESSLILNLNEPLALEDTSWIQPMKYMGIWWEMHINDSDWGQHNGNHGATTENAKYYIDFIEDYLTSDPDIDTIGLLIEGWNQGWNGNWMDNYDKFIFTEDGEYDDFDLSEVVAYGQDAGVSYIMHNETSGGILNYENQMTDAYSDYERLGIHAIKSGYVSDSGMQEPEGVHHHGQYMVNHYNEAVRLASEYEIMINTHEPIKPTGLSRTYPNWLAREGVQGMEYNAWSDGNPPEHTTILPFTRILGGPIDYTPGIFDVQIGGSNNRIHTTRANQLALYVVLYSPLQMITDLPANYLDQDGQPYEEFDFLRHVPVDWDDTVVVDAEIGDYVAIARKGKGGDTWYIGAITDEEARELSLDLSFLDEEKDYVAIVYADDEGTSMDQNPNEVLVYRTKVNASDIFHMALPEGGGAAMEIMPVEDYKAQYDQGDFDIDYGVYPDLQLIPDYNYQALQVTRADIETHIQANDDFEALVEVENTSSVMVGENLSFYIDGEEIYKTYMRIEPLTKKKVAFPYDLFYEPGDYRVQVGNFSELVVTVVEKEATLSIEDVNVFTNGNTVIARVKVLNTGSFEGSMILDFYVDGLLVESQDVLVGSAPGGQTKGINFKFEGNSGTTYSIGVNEEEEVLITP